MNIYKDNSGQREAAEGKLKYTKALLLRLVSKMFVVVPEGPENREKHALRCRKVFTFAQY